MTQRRLGPKRLLSREAEAALSARQVELLNALERMFLEQDVIGMTMAELASALGCSLRTLYGIAPSKEQLFLIAADRRLHRVGRQAQKGVDLEAPAVDALRAYLYATSEAIDRAAAMAAELERLPGGSELLRGHHAAVRQVTQDLLDRGVREGAIAEVDTEAVAYLLGRLAGDFATPDAAGFIRGDAKRAADHVADLLIAGLVRVS